MIKYISDLNMQYFFWRIISFGKRLFPRKLTVHKIILFISAEILLYNLVFSGIEVRNINQQSIDLHNSLQPFSFPPGNDIGWHFLVSVTVSCLRAVFGSLLALKIFVTQNTVNSILFLFISMNIMLILWSGINVFISGSVILGIIAVFCFAVSLTGGSLGYGSFSNRNFNTWACLNSVFILIHIYEFRKHKKFKFAYIVFFSFFLNYFPFFRGDSSIFIFLPSMILLILSSVLAVQFRKKSEYRIMIRNLFLSSLILLSAYPVEKYCINSFLNIVNSGSSRSEAVSEHGKWFPLYLGVMSFHSNPYNLAFDDDVGYLHENLFWSEIYDPNDKSVNANDGRYKRLFFMLAMNEPYSILKSTWAKIKKLASFLSEQKITPAETLFFVDVPSNSFLKYLFWLTFPSLLLSCALLYRVGDSELDILLLPVVSVLPASLIVPAVIWPGYASTVYGFMFSVCFVLMPYAVYMVWKKRNMQL